MTREERVKLIFETLSKSVGFEIKPFKEFYVSGSGLKNVYFIDEFFTLHCKTLLGYFVNSDYTILSILKGDLQLEEIKEPLTTKEERDFLRHFKFDELKISEISNDLILFDKDWKIVVSFDLNNIDFSFNGLEEDKKYSSKELGL